MTVTKLAARVGATNARYQPQKAGVGATDRAGSTSMTTNDTEEQECPDAECDRIFDSGRGVKVHHKKAHGESIATGGSATRDCDGCGGTIHRPPAGFVNQRTGEEHHRHFCSDGCREQWHQSWMEAGGEGHPAWDGGLVTVACDWCGDEKDVKPSTAERGRTFCDKRCEGAWRSENVVGPDHHNWKGGGQPNYGEGWTRARRRVRGRDGYECRDCGVTEAEAARELDVHHIWFVRVFDDPSDAHFLDNLLTVCRSCHRDRHTGGGD